MSRFLFQTAVGCAEAAVYWLLCSLAIFGAWKWMADSDAVGRAVQRALRELGERPGEVADLMSSMIADPEFTKAALVGAALVIGAGVVFLRATLAMLDEEFERWSSPSAG